MKRQIKIDGDYTYDGNNGNPYYYYRSIDWVAKDIQRNNLNQDILYSFYVFMTAWKITENDAENRIKAIEANDWRSIMSIKFCLWYSTDIIKKLWEIKNCH